MAQFIIEHTVEIFFSIISASAIGYAKYLYSRNKELQRMQREEQSRQYRQMIIDEIEPIIAELTRLKKEITDLEHETELKLQSAQHEADLEHKSMYDDLNKIQAKNDENFNLILNSYKFRLIQLCKVHLRDGYITETDFEQVSEMYKLYHGMGGNGQAQEYYDKVMSLNEMKSNYDRVTNTLAIEDKSEQKSDTELDRE